MKADGKRSLLLLPGVMLVVFIGEAIVMGILHACGIRGLWDIVLDPMLLSVLVTPCLLVMLGRFDRPSAAETPAAAAGGHRFRGTAFVVAVMGGVGVLVFAALASSHATSQTETVRTFQQHQLTKVRDLALAVEKVFDELGGDIRCLARDPNIVRRAPEARQEIDSYHLTHAGILSGVTLTDAEGNPIARSPASLAMKNVAKWAAFEATRRTGEPCITGPERDDAAGDRRVIHMTVPVGESGRCAGVLYVSVDLERLWDQCLSRTAIGGKSRLQVVDDRGTVLHDSREASAGPAARESERAARIVNERLRRGGEGTIVVANDAVGGIDELVAFAPIRIGGRRYGLALATPESEIAGPLQIHARVTYALTAVTLLFLGIGGYVVLRNVRARVWLQAERRRAAEREQAEATLLEANRRLRETTARANRMAVEAGAASRAKSEFLANMSHEIRTPLTAILGYADVLGEECVDRCRAGGEVREGVHAIRRNGKHLLELISDILDLSKIEAEQMSVERIACSPHRIVAEVAELVHVQTSAKGLEFSTEFIGAIPEVIQSDPLRLRQILINIIGNAVKFTRSGGVRLVVRLDGGGGEPRMQFDTIDTGIGMSHDQADRIFQPFNQADASTTRQFGGTGLGLAISKRLARLLGGDLTLVESQPGLGTRFRATVAAGCLDGIRMIEGGANDEEVVLRPRAHRSGPPSPEVARRLDGVQILLAEDGPDNQRLIAHMLRRAGAEVTIAENGKLAMEAALERVSHRDEAASAGRFDVILLDMQMPVMDGYEAATRLRAAGYRGAIIALTAHALASDQRKCLDAGCDDYATKPIDRDRLLEAIHRRVRGPQAVGVGQSSAGADSTDAA